MSKLVIEAAIAIGLVVMILAAIVLSNEERRVATQTVIRNAYRTPSGRACTADDWNRQYLHGRKPGEEECRIASSYSQAIDPEASKSSGAVLPTRLNETGRASLQEALRKMNHCNDLAHIKFSDLTTLDQVELNACPAEIERSLAAVRSTCKQLQSGSGGMSDLELRISSVCDEAAARSLF